MKVELPKIDNIRLFSTVTGSHMWNMNKPDSDIDVSSAYIMDTEQFLCGGKPNNHQTLKYKGNIDEARYEIANVVKHLKKGNVNYIWLITSPIVVSEKRNWLQRLRQIVIENPSKQMYWSIYGLARNNMKDFIERGDPQSLKYNKKLQVIGRTLKFGINFFLWERYIYEKVNIESREQLEDMVVRLTKLKDESNLPKHPPHKPFDEYLKDIRLWQIERYMNKT